MQRRTKRSAAQMRAKTAVRKAKPKRSAAPKSSRAKSSREKVRAYRQRMRAKGLRLVQMWVQDGQKPDRADAAAIQKAWTEALAIQPSEGPVTFDDLADLVGSVDGPEMDMRYKDEYLRATGYGRKRYR
jgi:hypothetical protein